MERKIRSRERLNDDLEIPNENTRSDRAMEVCSGYHNTNEEPEKEKLWKLKLVFEESELCSLLLTPILLSYIQIRTCAK